MKNSTFVLALSCGLIILTSIGMLIGYAIGSKSKRDYQIETTQAGTSIYDGNRLVKIFKFGEIPALDTLIINDNK